MPDVLSVFSGPVGKESSPATLRKTTVYQNSSKDIYGLCPLRYSCPRIGGVSWPRVNVSHRSSRHPKSIGFCSFVFTKKVYCHLSDCFGASWCIHHFDRNSDLKYYNVVSPKPKAAYHFTFTQIYHRVEGNINHTQNGGCDIGFIIPSLESPNPRANHCFSIELPFGKHPVHFQTHHIQPYGSCKPSYNGNWV